MCAFGRVAEREYEPDECQQQTEPDEVARYGAHHLEAKQALASIPNVNKGLWAIGVVDAVILPEGRVCEFTPGVPNDRVLRKAARNGVEFGGKPLWLHPSPKSALGRENRCP